MPRRDWKKRMWRRVIIRSVIIMLLLGLIAVGIWGFLLPYLRAESLMNHGKVVLQHLPDGGIRLTWPAAEKTDYYLVELLRPVEKENKKGEKEIVLEAVYSQEVTGSETCILRDVPLEEELTLRINTMIRYENPDETRVRPGDAPLDIPIKLAPPVAENITWKPDPQTDTITVNFSMVEGDKTRLWYHTGDENWQLLKTLSSGETTVVFDHNGDLPMLLHGEVYYFCMDSYRERPESTYYSCVSDFFTVVREDLLDRNLWVQMTDEGDNVCTLVWNETKGDHYDLQMRSRAGGDWVTVLTVARDGVRSFTTEHLPPFREYSFRVVAQGGQAVPGKPAAASDVITFQTREAVLFSTIWPIKELQVYADPDMTEAIGKVSGGRTLCVVEVHENCFGIRFSDEVTGYIDSNYVMIDLVDYLGELCAYDITNSYSSMYKISKYEMEDITEEQILGYENVRLRDGTYLVPLLYPVAQRLVKAAEAARDAGYRLKIYDSYRPNRTTEMLYEEAEKLLTEPVPGDIPDPTKDDPERLLTYGTVMTDDGKYPLNYFLAQGASLHNLGIALDLTIEKWDTRQEQPMQTKIHDLSFNSMIQYNNGNAKLLKKFMEGAGFGGLISEWWHFQDNEIRNQLRLPALWGGISAEGWKLSDGGWRYRLKNGTYATGTLQLGEKSYVFNEEGYLIP